MQKLAKLIRIISVAPVGAAIALSLIYFQSASHFKNLTHYVVALICLTVLPLLAYPVSLIWKSDKRRHYQRTLAIILSVTGYFGVFFFALTTSAPSAEKIIYLSYLLSGTCIALFSFVFKKKSSGHACGIVGPIALLTYYVHPAFLTGLLLLFPVYWSSLVMKRHSLSQLISGSIIPAVAMLLSVALFS